MLTMKDFEDQCFISLLSNVTYIGVDTEGTMLVKKSFIGAPDIDIYIEVKEKQTKRCGVKRRYVLRYDLRGKNVKHETEWRYGDGLPSYHDLCRAIEIIY